MKEIGDILPLDIPQKKKGGSERGELLEDLLFIVNRSRKQAGYKPWSIKLFAIRCGHLKTEHLYAIKSGTKGRENPAKYICWMTKTEKKDV